MSPMHSSSSSVVHDRLFPLPLFSQSAFPQAALGNVRPQARQTRMLEIAVATGIVALLIALLVPTLSSRDLTLPTATRTLVDHLRLARAGAASRGAHFRVTLQPHVYAIEQLQDHDGDGIWEPDGKIPALQVSLPDAVAIGAAERVIEFDARGHVSTTARD